MYAEGLYVSGDYLDAKTWFESICRLQPTGERFEKLGVCYWDSQEYMAADSCLRVSHWMRPAHVRPLYLQYKMHSELKNDSAAYYYAVKLSIMTPKISNGEAESMRQEARKYVEDEQAK